MGQAAADTKYSGFGSRHSRWAQYGNLLQVEPNDAIRIQLHRDYEAVSDAGLRRRSSDEALHAAVERLTAAGLASFEGTYFNLQRPEYGSVTFPEESLALLRGHYERWLHAEQVSAGEHVLYGRNGFWQHWWNVLHEWDDGPLPMHVIFPDVAELGDHNWVEGMQSDLIDELLTRNSISLRLILPPHEADGSVAEVASFLTGKGLDVRVRSSPFLFAVYGSSVVIADRENESGEEGYFLSKRPSIVGPLQRVFDEHWASAIPWRSFARGAADVLEMMSLGWTDARIAEALGISMRTVTRRVSDAMAAAGVSSRFELGIRFAQSRL